MIRRNVTGLFLLVVLAWLVAQLPGCAGGYNEKDRILQYRAQLNVIRVDLVQAYHAGRISAQAYRMGSDAVWAAQGVLDDAERKRQAGEPIGDLLAAFIRYYEAALARIPAAPATQTAGLDYAGIISLILLLAKHARALQLANRGELTAEEEAEILRDEAMGVLLQRQADAKADAELLPPSAL